MKKKTTRQSIQLQRKLLHSHLWIASMGVFIFIIGGSTVFWLRGYAHDLATVSGPKIESVYSLQAGVQESLANLRGWMAFKNTDFSKTRKKAWKTIIYPSLQRLELLENKAEKHQNLRLLNAQLKDLEMWQWLIEDVAQTPGNQPAQVTLRQKLKPLATRMFDAAIALLEITVLENGKHSEINDISSLVALRTQLYQMDQHLILFVEQGHLIDKSVFQDKTEQLTKDLKEITDQVLFSSQLSEQFNILKNSFLAYRQLANAVIWLRSSDEWNVANHLFISKALPLEKKISQQLSYLYKVEHENNQQVILLINQVSTIIPWLMAGLLLLMISLAIRMAKKGSQQFIAPVFELERQGQLTADRAALLHQMQGSGNISELSLHIIEEIASRVGALSASFYVLQEQDNVLKRMASYAVSVKTQVQLISYGEGLLGQAWASKKPIEVLAGQGQQLTVQSSLLDIVPGSIFILPVQYEDKVMAVLELVFVNALSDHYREYLDNSIRHVGIALHAMTQNMMLEQALQETQKKSDELLVRGKALTEQTKQLELSKFEALQKAEELEQASRYKSEFLANMSHELRTPLNSMLILSNILAENDDNNLNKEEVEYAQVIHESGSNLLNLINEVLDISKIEAGKMDVQNEKAVLPEVLEYLQRHFEHMAKDKELYFNTSISEDVPTEIVTDTAKLNQILVNLIGNAMKFTHQGGITVHIFSCAAEGIIADVSTPLIGFSVKDSGVGIPANKQEHIFHAFKQADGSTSRHYGGTGLGLSISVNFSHLLGGKIQVQSEEGKGSTFTLYIPHQPLTVDVKGIPAVMESPAIESSLSLQMQNINQNSSPPFKDDRDALDTQKDLFLIIEDDASFCKILFDTCHKKGTQVLIAIDGETGLTLAKSYPVKGIILDMMLPNLDGREVLRCLKSSPDTAHIPVHMISAMDDLNDIIELGAIDVLTKPVTTEQIQSVLDQLTSLNKANVNDVLVVEDDPASGMAIEKLLSKLGVNCHLVVSAENALQRLSLQKIDLMILDISLSGMTGCELLQIINADTSTTMPYVIVYTGKELSGDENESLQILSQKVIVKSAKSAEYLVDEVNLFLHSLDQPSSSLQQLPSVPVKRQQQILDDKEIIFNGVKILVVDDDMRNTFALSKILRKWDFNVLLAPSAERALQLLDDHTDIGMVLMDIMMPVMDGYEAMTAIRKRPAWKDLPIIALTANAMTGDKEKCLAAGANDYLTKPLDMNKLLASLQLWVSIK